MIKMILFSIFLISFFAFSKSDFHSPYDEYTMDSYLDPSLCRCENLKRNKNLIPSNQVTDVDKSELNFIGSIFSEFMEENQVKRNESICVAILVNSLFAVATNSCIRLTESYIKLSVNKTDQVYFGIPSNHDMKVSYENDANYVRRILTVHTIGSDLVITKQLEDMLPNFIVGLIQFKRPFELGEKFNIYPACLGGEIEYYHESKFFAAGFNTRAKGTKLRIIEFDKKELRQYSCGLFKACFKGLDASCQIDEGSPLMYYNAKEDRFLVVGFYDKVDDDCKDTIVFQFSRFELNFKLVRDTIFALVNNAKDERSHICQLGQLQDEKEKFCQCKDYKLTKSRIINGEVVGFNELTFVASLVLQELISTWTSSKLIYSSICSGIILNQRFVLTAAHCIKTIDLKAENRTYFAVGGKEHRLRSLVTQKYGKKYVKRLIVYPDYLQNSFPSNFDIGLIELKNGFNFHNPVGSLPACLSDLGDSFVTEGSEVRLAGYGFSASEGGARNLKLDFTKETMNLMTANQKIVSCDPAVKNSHCAISDDNSPCIVDSGGPLLKYSEELKKLYVIGVLSFVARSRNEANSYKCPFDKKTNYVDVTRFWNWIRKYTGNDLCFTKSPANVVESPKN